MDNIHWAVGGLVLLYVLLAECIGFYLLGPPSPGQDPVESRCTECMILWGLVYVIIIMSSAALKKPIMNRRAVAWGTLIPVLCGFAVVGWVWWRRGFTLDQSAPRGLLRIYVSLQPAFPGVEGLAIGALVWLEGKLVCPRVPLEGSECYCKCGYDLMGNVSGTCPECGTKIERDASRAGAKS